MNTFRARGLILTLAVAGCAMAGSVSAAEEPKAGTVVPQGEMTVFCQKAAAARFEADLEDITTDPPVEREGKLLVLGTVDSDDDNRDAGFDCRFEKNGAYIGIIGAPAE
jgi:hypothetical protein